MRAGLGFIGLTLCGVALLAVAAWLYFIPEDGPGLTVDEPEREIFDCLVKQTKVVTFLFHNRARHPVVVIGLAPC